MLSIRWLLLFESCHWGHLLIFTVGWGLRRNLLVSGEKVGVPVVCDAQGSMRNQRRSACTYFIHLPPFHNVGHQ